MSSQSTLDPRDDASVSAGNPSSAPLSTAQPADHNHSVSAQTVSKKPRAERWPYVMLSVIAVVVVCGILAVIYWVAATVQGIEMDALSWQTRSFHFLRDPFSETQLTDIRLSTRGGFSLDPSIASHINGGVIRPPVPRWDLVRISRGTKGGKGDADILLTYLQTTDNQRNLYWVEWTSDNPQAAPTFWGAVRDAVHLSRYDRLPQLFDAARIADDPAALKQRLADSMLALAVDEAQRQTAAGNPKAARRAAELGLHYGSSAELQTLVESDPAD